VVISEDGRDDNGRKKEKEKGRGEDLTEVLVSGEKIGWRFSVPTLAGNMEIKQVRLRVKASIRIDPLVGQKTGRWMEDLSLSEVAREEWPGYGV